jgi:hypothetical protein
MAWAVLLIPSHWPEFIPPEECIILSPGPLRLSDLRNLGLEVRYFSLLTYTIFSPKHSLPILLPSIQMSNAMPQSTRASSVISSTGSPPPPAKRRRRRPARSCEQCRRRKIRCSLGQPCNGCVRARVPMQCSYRDGSPVEAASETRTLAPVEARAARDEVIATPQSQANTAGYHRDQVSRPSRLDNNNTPVLNRESHVSQSISSPQVSITTPSSTSIPPFTPRLRHVPEKTKLFGQTHWLHTAEKVRPPLPAIPSVYESNAAIVPCLGEFPSSRSRAIVGRRQVRVL